jgi:hypothetical protein
MTHERTEKGQEGLGPATAAPITSRFPSGLATIA